MAHTLALNPWGGSRLPDIRQAEAAECGLACLAMIAGYHGRYMDLATLRRQHPISIRGASLRSIMSIAAELGFAARPLRLGMSNLRISRHRQFCIGTWTTSWSCDAYPVAFLKSRILPLDFGVIPTRKPGSILPVSHWNSRRLRHFQAFPNVRVFVSGKS